MIKKILLILLFFTTSLQEASQNYIANTEQEAIEISRQLIPEGGKPGNICGPLSLQILKDAGYVEPDVPIKSFWFLRPWETWVQENVINVAFPIGGWEYHYFSTALDNIDFSEFPLRPGDFIFFFYGYSCGGTFSHMLVVTRVENGKAYTVTNHLTDDGWRITEELLYDLNNPDAYGFFDRLTDKANTNTIGTTGYCGFSLWRKIIYPWTHPCRTNFCPY